MELSKQGLLSDDKIQEIELCDYFIFGKAKRVKFGQGRHTSSRPLEYIHSDLWGPSKTQTHGGGHYFMSIVDDYSRKVWTYLLKTKDEETIKFREWLLLTENRSGYKVKYLRTNNGLEYMSKEFKDMCINNGISRHFTTPGTPTKWGNREDEPHFAGKSKLFNTKCWST